MHVTPRTSIFIIVSNFPPLNRTISIDSCPAKRYLFTLLSICSWGPVVLAHFMIAMH